MPELPEVETVVATLRPRLVGRTLVVAGLSRDDIVTPSTADLPALLAGRRVVDVSRRGKRIVFALDDGCRFYVHLGMTGQLTVAAADAAAPPHTHLEIKLGPAVPAGGSGRGEVLRFRDPRRFGGVWWLGPDEPADRGMGPEPLTLRPAALALRLAGTARAVKVALLDQAVVAGLGNIYVDESLFLARIHPLRPARGLTAPEVGRLSRAIKLTLRRAIRHRGSTLRDYRDADGNAGGFQSLHRVYDRAGEPCRACRTAVARIVLGGRSTHFCPKCQEGL
ncbi:MAG: formamidopyrimidine-DNA glycosylase [Phycisphaerales bacterium]|nr:formamidopyrimidine-DNA glycosylase [Phycisphaerales bacterium]